MRITITGLHHGWELKQIRDREAGADLLAVIEQSIEGLLHAAWCEDLDDPESVTIEIDLRDEVCARCKNELPPRSSAA
jgi:hypothetical protein